MLISCGVLPIKQLPDSGIGGCIPKCQVPHPANISKECPCCQHIPHEKEFLQASLYDGCPQNLRPEHECTPQKKDPSQDGQLFFGGTIPFLYEALRLEDVTHYPDQWEKLKKGVLQEETACWYWIMIESM